MPLNKQNPGGQAGASRNQLGGWLHSSITALDRQAQTPACMFGPAHWMAQNVANSRLGEARNG